MTVPHPFRTVSPAPRRGAHRPAPIAASVFLAALLLSPPPSRGAEKPDVCPPATRGTAASPAKPAATGTSDPLVELARSKRRVVIADFGMGMCKQCKKQGEILDEVRKAYGDKVEVRFVHVGKEAELADRYGVSMIPHLVFLDPSGKVRHAATGVSSFEKIADQLAKLGVRR